MAYIDARLSVIFQVPCVPHTMPQHWLHIENDYSEYLNSMIHTLNNSSDKMIASQEQIRRERI